MPYPTEHAARLAEPEKFQKFRRENDKFGPGIDAIWGVRADGNVTLQAIRFDAERYTMDDVKKWLKEHDHDALKIEKASGESKTCEDARLESKRLEGGSAGEISGYASVFDVLDSDGDVVRKGAYAKTCKEAVQAGKVALMLKHMVHGGDVAESIGIVREAREDDYGLWFRGELFSTDGAQDARVKVAEGKSAFGASVGYRVIRSTPKKLPSGKTGRDIHEMALYEITITLLPACKQTQGTLEAKAEQDEIARLTARVEQLENKLKTNGTEQPAGKVAEEAQASPQPATTTSADSSREPESVAALRRRQRLDTLRRKYRGRIG